MNLNELFEDLSATALPPVTASRTQARPLELSSRPAWFDAIAEPPTPGEAAHSGSTPSRPAQDEWGIFDPDQCGFSALFDKIDAIAEAK